MQTLYTLGYCGHTPAQIKQHVDRLGAILCDIRLHARSMAPQWRGAAICALVGPERYLRLPCLGNLNYKTGGPIDLANPEGAVMRLTWVLSERPAILLCGCADHVGCHRTPAAAWVAARLGDLVAGVVHLDPIAAAQERLAL